MKYRLLLLLASFIWGTAFIAQRVSMDTMGPFSFNGLRFTLAALSLVPLVICRRNSAAINFKKPPHHITLPVSCIILGFILFAGVSFQQLGLFYTTVGKAGFITALYIVNVPIFGLFLYNPLRLSHVGGCIIAVIGLYFLAFHDDGQLLNFGNMLELIGVIFWTLHILLVSQFTKYYSGIRLAIGQFAVCSIFNGFASIITGEILNWSIIMQTLIPILYGGVLSGGVAYTLQIIGQSHVAPTEASLILSFEMIFSALSAYFILGETMNWREIGGCVLMGIGIFSAQIPSRIIWRGFKLKSWRNA